VKAIQPEPLPSSNLNRMGAGEEGPPRVHTNASGEEEEEEEELHYALRVFNLPRLPSWLGEGAGSASAGAGAGAGAGMTLVCTLGGASSPSPLRFLFDDAHGPSGWMAFTGPATSRLLVVTDAGHGAVHVVDVVRRVHVGYVAAPGTIAGPRGVAARGSLVAVSAWKQWHHGDHVVRVFEGSGALWTAVRTLAGGFGGPGRADGQRKCPYGLRFAADGTGLAVADVWNNRVSLLRVEDGSFVRHVATGQSAPWDVEECEGGWLVACWDSDTVTHVDGCLGDVGAPVGGRGSGAGEFKGPSALALVPGLGLLVREQGNRGRLQVFATRDAIAMASMSACRVAWLACTARAALHRHGGRSSSSARASDTPPTTVPTLSL
jgi:hypothetical protein